MAKGDNPVHATSRLSGVAMAKGDNPVHATPRLSGVARPKAVNDTYDAATSVEETAPAGVVDDVPENSTGRAAKRPRDEDPERFRSPSPFPLKMPFMQERGQSGSRSPQAQSYDRWERDTPSEDT
jgi:hypothetical protein